ncbi:MAG: hypothetical protein H0Z34_10925 [Brevibacillus sp.]|nr:hypothetical protein [Brevibacillus sp.]
MESMSLYRAEMVEVDRFSTKHGSIKDTVEAIYLFRTFAEVFHDGQPNIWLVMNLDQEGRILGVEVIPAERSSQLRASDVFAGAILRKARAIMVCRYCPSEMTPCQDEQELGNRLKKAGIVLGIEVKDFILVTKNRYFSLMERREFGS